MNTKIQTHYFHVFNYAVLSLQPKIVLPNPYLIYYYLGGAAGAFILLCVALYFSWKHFPYAFFIRYFRSKYCAWSCCCCCYIIVFVVMNMDVYVVIVVLICVVVSVAVFSYFILFYFILLYSHVSFSPSFYLPSFFRFFLFYCLIAALHFLSLIMSYFIPFYLFLLINLFIYLFIYFSIFLIYYLFIYFYHFILFHQSMRSLNTPLSPHTIQDLHRN